MMEKLYVSKLVLVCYRNFRYPGCTTRTSVPSQPTDLQKPSYKKNRIYKIKNHPTTAAQPSPTQPNPHHHHCRPTQPNPTQREKKFQLAKAVKINYKTKMSKYILN